MSLPNAEKDTRAASAWRAPTDFVVSVPIAKSGQIR